MRVEGGGRGRRGYAAIRDMVNWNSSEWHGREVMVYFGKPPKIRMEKCEERLENQCMKMSGHQPQHEVEEEQEIVKEE